LRMNVNLAHILGVEAICAAQGVEFRAPLVTSPALQGVLTRLRARVATIREDRYLAPDLEVAGEMVACGALCEGLDLPRLEGGE